MVVYIYMTHHLPSGLSSLALEDYTLSVTLLTSNGGTYIPPVHVCMSV